VLALPAAAALLDLWLLRDRCSAQQGCLVRQLHSWAAAVGAHQMLQPGAPAAQPQQDHPLLLKLQGCALVLHQRQQQQQSQVQELRQGLVLAASGVIQLPLATQAPVQGAV
jgi:hypothetical protein